MARRSRGGAAIARIRSRARGKPPLPRLRSGAARAPVTRIKKDVELERRGVFQTRQRQGQGRIPVAPPGRRKGSAREGEGRGRRVEEFASSSRAEVLGPCAAGFLWLGLFGTRQGGGCFRQLRSYSGEVGAGRRSRRRSHRPQSQDQARKPQRRRWAMNVDYAFDDRFVPADHGAGLLERGQDR